MTTVDLRDAYLHVLIHPEHQAFLRYAMVTQEGTTHWQFGGPPLHEDPC